MGDGTEILPVSKLAVLMCITEVCGEQEISGCDEG